MDDATILIEKMPVTKEDAGQIQTTFASAGYLLLKEVIAAHCVDRQVQAMNVGLYDATNPAADAATKAAKAAAARYKSVLDVLDELEGKPDDWFKVKLEPRR